MRTLLSTFGLVSLVVSLSAPALVGCTADSSDPTDGVASASTEDPRSLLSADAKAVTLWEGGKENTIAAPAKLAAIAHAIEGDLAAVGGVPRCPPAYTLTYLDAKAKPMATVSRCGDKAYLKVGAKVFEVPADDAQIHGAFASARAVGDLLWGVDVMVSEDGEPTRDPVKVAVWAKAFDGDAVPQALSAPPSEEKLIAFTFERAGKEAAQITLYAPADDKAMSGPATISVDGELLGWTTFSLAPILGGGF